MNCINCGNYVFGDMLSITPYGLVPTCSPQCLQQLNNSDAPLDRLQQMYLDNFKKGEDERRRQSNT